MGKEEEGWIGEEGGGEGNGRGGKRTRREAALEIRKKIASRERNCQQQRREEGTQGKGKSSCPLRPAETARPKPAP